MTEQLNIAELRRLHEADSAKIINAMANIDWQQHLMNGGGCFHVEDNGQMCGRADRWPGHGSPGFHMFVPLYVAATKLAKSNALPRLLAALEEARAERGEARSLLLNGIQTNGDSLAFLEHVRREHAAVVDELGAIKATLAKHAESERAWCELATERGAKLAALANYRIDHRLECEFDPPNAKACTCGLAELVAAAKVQPEDLESIENEDEVYARENAEAGLMGEWMMHDMETATIVTAKKPGQQVAHCRDGNGNQDAMARHIISLHNAWVAKVQP